MPWDSAYQDALKRVDVGREHLLALMVSVECRVLVVMLLNVCIMSENEVLIASDDILQTQGQ